MWDQELGFSAGTHYGTTILTQMLMLIFLFTFADWVLLGSGESNKG